MKVLVTMKVKAVNGPESGTTYEQSGIMETESSVSELGIICGAKMVEQEESEGEGCRQ